MTQADLLDKVSFIMCLLHYAHVPNTSKKLQEMLPTIYMYTHNHIETYFLLVAMATSNCMIGIEAHATMGALGHLLSVSMALS